MATKGLARRGATKRSGEKLEKLVQLVQLGACVDGFIWGTDSMGEIGRGSGRKMLLRGEEVGR